MATLSFLTRAGEGVPRDSQTAIQRHKQWCQAISCDKLGCMCRAEGDLGAAREFFRKAHEILGQLAREGPSVSSVQVARALRVSRPSVARMLDVLAEKELVTREHYGKIQLTETGAALARELAAGLRDLERRLPALELDLSPEETAAAAGALAAALPERCFRRLCTAGPGEAVGSAKP